MSMALGALGAGQLIPQRAAPRMIGGAGGVAPAATPGMMGNGGAPHPATQPTMPTNTRPQLAPGMTR